MASLFTHPIHLGRAGQAVPQPAFTGMAWYDDYAARHGDEGAEGRLVTLYRFEESWTSWEMHPAGEEVVLCVAGEMIVHQEVAGRTATVRLGGGDYVVNPAGVWHTADITQPATALFITVGEGTEHRPRSG